MSKDTFLHAACMQIETKKTIERGKKVDAIRAGLYSALKTSVKPFPSVQVSIVYF